MRAQPEFAESGVTIPLGSVVKEPWVLIWTADLLERRPLGTGLPLCSLQPAQISPVFTQKGIISFQMGGHLADCSQNKATAQITAEFP